MKNGRSPNATSLAAAVDQLIELAQQQAIEYPLLRHILWHGEAPTFKDGQAFYYGSEPLYTDDLIVIDTWRDMHQNGLGGMFLNDKRDRAARAFAELSRSAWHIARAVTGADWPDGEWDATMRRPDVLWLCVMYACAWCRTSHVLQAQWWNHVHVIPIHMQEPADPFEPLPRLRKRFPFDPDVEAVHFMLPPLCMHDGTAWAPLEPGLFVASAIVLQVLRTQIRPEHTGGSAPEPSDAETEQWFEARWFSKFTDKPMGDRLREAAKAGRIRWKKVGYFHHYPVSDVIREWPKHREQMLKAAMLKKSRRQSENAG